MAPTLALVDGRYETRLCAWCRGEISATARRDAITCSKRCRQARHRFGRGCVSQASATAPLSFAYADPPYPGTAHLYRGHPDYAGEVDHGELLSRLQGFDGWALSTSSLALPHVLALCVALDVADVRVAAWFRGARGRPRSYRPQRAWEPVIYAGGRADVSRGAGVDALQYVARARTTDPRRVIGAKPAAFIWWLFDLLGLRPGDELVDLFPGSGGISRAWTLYNEQAVASRATGTRPVVDPSTPGKHDASRDDRHATGERRISSDSRLKYTVTATSSLPRSPEISP